MTDIEKKHYTVLLSEEQVSVSVMEGERWLRAATPDEIAAVEERHPGIVFDDLAIDKTGRSYYWMTIDAESCPSGVLAKVTSNVRVFRW